VYGELITHSGNSGKDEITKPGNIRERSVLKHNNSTLGPERTFVDILGMGAG